MLKTHIIVAIFISIALSCNAINIATTSGNLEKDLNNDTQITSLTISGTIDVRDFKYINEHLNNLTEIDLQDAVITEFSGNVAYFGVSYNYLANSVPQLAMFGKMYTSVKLPSTVASIGDGAFSGCTELSEIVFPSSVVEIGEYAFYDCDKIKQVYIPSTVKKLGNYAFSKCDNLEMVVIATDVSEYCFANCENLNNVIIDNEVKSINKGAFINATALKTINFGGFVASIGDDAFYGSGLTEADIYQASHLKTIGNWAFANNQSLATIKLPTNVETIGEGAFFNDKTVDFTDFPLRITSISDFLFTGCSNMSSEILKDKDVEQIGKFAFANWSQMDRFVIPQTVSYIGDNAFENCSNLLALYAMRKEAAELGENVFKGIDQPNTKLYVLTESELAYRNALQWQDFNIIPSPTSVEDNIKENAIKVYFSDKSLNIDAPAEIKTARLFDINGAQLALVNPHIQSTQIATEMFSGNYYILTVELSNGKIQHFKLVRK